MLSHLRNSFRNGSFHCYGLHYQSTRCISSAEIATALRPFYFVVHPDLFGRHPKQRSVNEESLKHLSAHLEALQQQRPVHTSAPNSLAFYVRQTTQITPDAAAAASHFKLIRISIDRRRSDAKTIIHTLLKSCNLPTDFVDAIRSASPSASSSSASANTSSRRYRTSGADTFYGSAAFDDAQDIANRIRKVKRDKTLKDWLDENLATAHERWAAMEMIRQDVAQLEKAIVERLQLHDIQYDSGWNVEHYRGCLKSLNRMADLYERDLQPLRGRTVLFAPCSGVNLEGQVMLFTGDVQRSWLDFIRHIDAQDAHLARIPSYESALSHVLLGITIARRKFMPKAQVTSYADQLRRVTTAMLDYLANGAYPERWPASLGDFELVVESEAGPLMVSPTGQFITPSTCSGSSLVDFLNTHMDEARTNIAEYQKNKHIERDLHERCLAELQLSALTKDDSIDPGRMIECMTRLLASASTMRLSGVHLSVTNYYSVLADGTVCIPWDWRWD